MINNLLYAKTCNMKINLQYHQTSDINEKNVKEDFVVSSLFNRTDNLTLRRERNNCCPKSKLFSTQGYLRINFHGQPHMVYTISLCQ